MLNAIKIIIEHLGSREHPTEKIMSSGLKSSFL